MWPATRQGGHIRRLNKTVCFRYLAKVCVSLAWSRGFVTTYGWGSLDVVGKQAAPFCCEARRAQLATDREERPGAWPEREGSTVSMVKGCC